MNDSSEQLTSPGGKAGRQGSSGRRLLLGAGLIIVVLVLAGFGGWLLLRPCLYITSGDHIFSDAPVKTGDRFSTRFIHSVQKTPVLENFVVDTESKEIILDSTKYQSFDVGLPFLRTDGSFKMQDGYFLMENMNRHFPSVTMRTGVGTKLTVFINDREIRLYEELPNGTAVKFYIAPYYKRFTGQ